MSMDLRTISITPLRQTFGHLARRMGADKPATRYMEATMDLQPVENYHYRPTWEPQYEIFDASRTRIVMQDWYALKDPRQYYYGPWTLARGRMGETAGGDFDLVDELGLAAAYPAQGRDLALSVLLPLRLHPSPAHLPCRHLVILMQHRQRQRRRVMLAFRRPRQVSLAVP